MSKICLEQSCLQFSVFWGDPAVHSAQKVWSVPIPFVSTKITVHAITNLGIIWYLCSQWTSASSMWVTWQMSRDIENRWTSALGIVSFFSLQATVDGSWWQLRVTSLSLSLSNITEHLAGGDSRNQDSTVLIQCCPIRKQWWRRAWPRNSELIITQILQMVIDSEFILHLCHSSQYLQRVLITIKQYIMQLSTDSSPSQWLIAENAYLQDHENTAAHARIN